MKNEYRPAGQAQIGYYDACQAIENQMLLTSRQHVILYGS